MSLPAPTEQNSVAGPLARFGPSVRRAAIGVAGLATTGAGYAVAVVTGRLTLDLRIGRRRRPLGPIDATIEAPRPVVHAVIAEPYLKRPTHAMAAKLRVVERGSDMVVAEHFTRLGSRLVATTVESVRFSPPARVDFRLLRGPVPAVLESFELDTTPDEGTRLRYQGTLETDLWYLGALWGRIVAKHWTRTVSESLASIKAEAERRARHKR